MVSKKWLKLVKSLHQKKYRNQHKLFFVEGAKLVNELLGEGLKPVKIFVYQELIGPFLDLGADVVNGQDLKKVSALQHPNGVLGVFEIPDQGHGDQKDWILALDDVRDPGNLGTIIRMCDWYGIPQIICSVGTVDCYNPKVLQATMGSIARVNLVYENLENFLKSTSLPVFGAFMDGHSVYQAELPKSGVLVMGNEGQGISPGVGSLVKRRISIPQYGKQTAESLNVAMATGILLNEIRRG